MSAILSPEPAPTAADRQAAADDRAPIGPGAFVAVVGPSGAGKDTLLRLAKQRLAGDVSIGFPRRLITRGPDANEDHVPVTEAEFAAALAQRQAAMSWTAHGLGYAVPVEADDLIRSGGIAVVNVSRRAVTIAAARYRRLAVVVVTAPPEVLAERLSKRGREDAGAVIGRLARADDDVPDVGDVMTINNVGDPAEGAEALVSLIRRLKDATTTLP
ncbi:MAG: phosphonate metabolism protein/1,5-bisphosphokinase (PRPP-forming) PhnN [Ancalomicrobiaceae bacterium]|nr:phosphonate metabolism protein/1,5-bisphosphokinase (PRPP-forming) PhnN [Ancalomicrobiaceae bacterium]